MILLPWLFACQDKENKSVMESQPIPLVGSELPIPSDSLGLPMTMDIVDNFLVITDRDSKSLFKVIDLKKERVLGSFGAIGRGPGEYNQFAQISKIPSEEKLFGVFDKGDFKYSIFPLDSVLKNPNYSFQKEYGSFNSNHQRIAMVTPNLFIGIGLFENRYVLSDSGGQIIKGMYDYPFVENFKDISHYDLGMAYQGHLKIKPNGKRFIMATSSSPTIEFFHIFSDSISKIKEIHSGYPSFVADSNPTSISVTFKGDNVEGFRHVSVTDDYAYLLYSGRTREADGLSAYRGNIVLVYNWDGEQVRAYLLDKDADLIGVDPSNQYLYTISNEMEPKIYYYLLKD